MDYRQRIISEAATMFRVYGIRAVTMDMLANRMGISKRTIYEVFRDKEELLAGVLKWMTEKQREIMERSLEESGNVIEAVFGILNVMRDHFRDMSPAFMLDMKKYHHNIVSKLKDTNELPYVGINALFIERGIEEGVFRKDIDVGIIDKCMLEVTRIINDRDIFPPDDFPKEDVISNLYLNYLRGISTQKGLELIEYYEKKRKD